MPMSLTLKSLQGFRRWQSPELFPEHHPRASYNSLKANDHCETYHTASGAGGRWFESTHSDQFDKGAAFPRPFCYLGLTIVQAAGKARPASAAFTISPRIKG